MPRSAAARGLGLRPRESWLIVWANLATVVLGDHADRLSESARQRRLDRSIPIEVRIITSVALIVVGAVASAVAAWWAARNTRRRDRPRRVRDVSSAAATPTTSSGAPAGRRIIAVIGIDHYPHWPLLHNAVGDARGALELFRRHGFALAQRRDGSEVAPLFDHAATGDAIRTLLTEDLEKLDVRDSLIVFFAGHGHTTVRAFPDGDAVTTGYIVPIDGGPAANGPRRWLRIDALLSDIARLPPRHILVILDACSSGVALQSLNQLVQLRRGATRARRDRRSRRVITSALHDQSAQDNGPVPGHSVFTGCLIDGFATGDIAPGQSQVTGSEIGMYLQKRVGSYTSDAQTPDFGAFELDGRGDLVVELTAAAAAEDAKQREDTAGEVAPGDAATADRAPRPALPHVALVAAVTGMVTLGAGAFRLLRDTAPPPPPFVATLPLEPDPCRIARDAIARSNPFIAVSSDYEMQAHEISEQEWYALGSCHPIASTDRVAKSNITAAEAHAFCDKLGAELPSIEIWRTAYLCAERASSARDTEHCAIENLADGVEELTADTDDTRPGHPMVYVIGGSRIMNAADPSKPRRLPATHSGGVTGARCVRRRQ